MNKEMKEWIDNASYVELLRRWRHAPVGSPWFQDEMGDYYKKVLTERRQSEDHIAASKEVGW